MKMPGDERHYEIENNGAGKKDIWILGAITVGIIVCLVVVLSNFG